jgi:CPA1 family monovalent cation:H+ antiporter
MELTTFAIILLIAIVFSNLLDSAFPKLPLPLLQIGCGVAIALTPLDTKLDLEPEIFMGLLIAPLLFREAEEADFIALWKLRKTVFFMVFGLVFVTVLVIGFTVHSLVPVIPLAACFCLGAVLGPTDAIAVSTVSDRIEIDAPIMNILKGEFLINDASGVISFNFAALALVTGSFSLLNASVEFLILCAGGLVVGLGISMAKWQLMRTLSRSAIRNASAFMVIEMLTPFICFFLAERLGFSGIIAAVAAGISQAMRTHSLARFEAEFAAMKKSLWQMITLIFNSFIFILLGLQLPSIVESVVRAGEYPIGFAMVVGLYATGVLFAVRFLGVVAATRSVGDYTSSRERLRGWLVLTLSGVKGTVSLATAFSLPFYIAGGEPFGQRGLLLLITACAIIYSLVIAQILLPIVARNRAPERRNKAYARLLRDVAAEVEAEGGPCASAVSINLKKRARELDFEDLHGSERRRVRVLYRELLEIEIRYLRNEVRTGQITEAECRVLENLFAVVSVVATGNFVSRLIGRVRLSSRLFGAAIAEMRRDTEGRIPVKRIQDIFWSSTGFVGEVIERKYRQNDEVLIANVLEDLADVAGSVMERAFGEGLRDNLYDEYDKALKQSFYLERRMMHRYLEDGRITDEEADRIRVEINKLETFAIEDLHTELGKKRFERRLASRRRNR